MKRDGNIWRCHTQSARGCVRLYDALDDEDSLEGRAFQFCAKDLSPAVSAMLHEVFLSRHPGALPISKENHKGHKIVVDKLKMKPVNISDKLFAVLRSKVKPPQELWQEQQKALAESAAEASSSPAHSLAMRIAQRVLRTELTDRVKYDSSAGSDIALQLTVGSDVEKVVVSKISPDGPASEAQIHRWSEVVRIEPMGRSGMDRLKRRLKHQGQGIVGDLIRDLGWAYPVELEFKSCLADLEESQVRYVREPDLEAPLVMAGYQDSFRGERNATIIVNLEKCEFHGESQQSDCPHGPESCFCGLDIILDGLMEELCQQKSKLSTQQRRWVDAATRKLYNKHQHEFNFGQRVPRTPVGRGPQVDRRSDSEEQRMSHLLDCWMSGDFSGLTHSEKQAIHLAELVDSRRAQAISVQNPQKAWLGDKMNDCYVAVQGVLHNLSPKELDWVRCERLSAQGPGGIGLKGGGSGWLVPSRSPSVGL